LHLFFHFSLRLSVDFSAQVLARLAAHDGPISFLPLDFLCILLHQCLRESVPDIGAGTAAAPLPAYARSHSDVTHLRLVPAGSGRSGACLVRLETVKLFNRRGEVTQVLHWCVRACCGAV
jgi:hypothetical protein